MRVAARVTLALSVILGAVGCGGDDRENATKTVTVPARTETVTATAPAPSEPAPSDGVTDAAESVGPPLPAGVVGIDGRYLLKAVNSDYQGQDIGDRFFSYEEPSHAATRCAGDRCSVAFRLGLKSGGSKTYTLSRSRSRGDIRRHGERTGHVRLP